jgi:predicted DNA-binding transcriptional regulator AlpA
MEVDRFRDLQRKNIVRNWTTLYRWIATENFPKPVRLRPNSIGFIRSDVEAWLAKRQAA